MLGNLLQLRSGYQHARAAATRELRAAKDRGEVIAIAASQRHLDEVTQHLEATEGRIHANERHNAELLATHERLLTLAEIDRPLAFREYRAAVQSFMAGETRNADQITEARATLRDLDDLEHTVSESLFQIGEP